MTDPWRTQREALGAFIRSQRKMANLSLRQLAQLTSLSNPYLSQVERGLHQPSVRVLRQISDALNLSAENLLAEAGLIDVVTGDRAGDRAGTSDAGTSDAGTSDAGAGDAGASANKAGPAEADTAETNTAEADAAEAGAAEAGAVRAAAPPGTEDAIRADNRLTEEQKAALIAVYHSMAG